MSVTDYQVQLPNGLVIGDGTAYGIVAIRGLEDMPAMRSSDVDRPQDHGMFAGKDYLSGRTFEMDIEVTDGGVGSDAVFRANVDALGVATAPAAAEGALTFQLPGGANRIIYCRPRRRSMPVDMSHKFRMPTATVQFAATDPRIYDATLQTANLSIPVVSGGLAFPLAFPLSFGSATGGSVVVTNTGSFGSRPVVTINGPITNPKIERVTPTDQFLLLNIALLTGDVLTVDFQAKTILLGGTATRYSSLDPSSTWWELAPGSNQVQLSATSGTGNASVAFRSAWV